MYVGMYVCMHACMMHACMYVCICVCFLVFSLGPSQRVSKYCCFCSCVDFLHKIVLEDVAGRSWGGVTIYIYTYIYI